jgi:hypothetical protein
MDQGQINISWDDLTTRRVENRLREQQAVARNRAYSQLKEEALPQATPTRAKLWHNTFVVATTFGLLGGLLAWLAQVGFAAMLPSFSATVLHYDPRAEAKADEMVTSMENIEIAKRLGTQTPQQAQIAIEQIQASAQSNPYFAVKTDAGLSDTRRESAIARLHKRDKEQEALIQVIYFALFGLMISLCLAIADPLSQHKTRQAIINGTAGGILGIVGGVAAAMVGTQLADGELGARFAQSQWTIMFGTLGMFLGIASGLAVRNIKRLWIGLIGGLVGGAIGGALINPLHAYVTVHNAWLVALLAIGGLAAAATGLLEQAAKAGWLKVSTGIIAGKQFILYRNPTYIGSAPDCQIYLFKDPKVGKRHAAIHLTPAGIEIEDLPLGVDTFVNGRAVKRSPLKNGDRIEIGATQFVFQERRPKAAKA